MDDLFRVPWLLLERQHHRVGNDIVDEIGAGRAGITEIASLKRRRPIGKNADPRIGGMTLEVDRNIGLEIPQKPGDLLIGARSHVEKAIKRRNKPRAKRAAVIRTK